MSYVDGDYVYVDSRGKRHTDCKKYSVPRTCQYCSDSVVYWECNHGCKVFFNRYEDGGGNHKDTCLFYPHP